MAVCVKGRGERSKARKEEEQTKKKRKNEKEFDSTMRGVFSRLVGSVKNGCFIIAFVSFLLLSRI